MRLTIGGVVQTLMLIAGLMFFMIPIFGFSAEINASAERSYAGCSDYNFNLTSIENRWINGTTHTINWVIPRTNDDCWDGFYYYNTETGIDVVVCRSDLSDYDKEVCVVHELCHERETHEYYANPPRNQVYLSERYKKENNWEERCYEETDRIVKKPVNHLIIKDLVTPQTGKQIINERMGLNKYPAGYKEFNASLIGKVKIVLA